MPMTAPIPAAILADVRVLPPGGLNTTIYLDLNRFSRHTAWAHGFMHTYALWLGPALLVAVFLVAYAVAWWQRAPRATMLLAIGGVGTLVALGINQVVGHAAKELRPYATHPNVLVLVAKSGDYSFPSDHAVLAGALLTSVLIVIGRASWETRAGGVAGTTSATTTAASGKVSPVVLFLGVLGVILGLFLCFARVYVGAHYPGDVVAGVLLGAVVVLVMSLLRPFAWRLADLADTRSAGVLLRRPGHRRAH